MIFPLNKVCDKQDLQILPPLLDPAILEGQHEIRWWEYALATQAIQEWQHASRDYHASFSLPRSFCDVGGGGSQFFRQLASLGGEVTVIDPTCTPGVRGGVQFVSLPIEHFTTVEFDVITCLSVIEHIKEPGKFLRALTNRLAPGGLLVLTTDYWDSEGEDTAHFHWMRERIYDHESWRKVRQRLRDLGLITFGASDWSYHGPQVYDYSIASLVMEKQQ